MVLLVESVKEFPDLELVVVDRMRQSVPERIRHICKQPIDDRVRVALPEGQGGLRIIIRAVSGSHLR